jgi:riboflavin synthase
MFTGIVEEIGEIVEAGAGVLRVRAPQVLTDVRLGDSIAINGVDLTIAEIVGDTFVAHVMPETYRRSNSSRLKPGERVNLERSLRPTDRLSGHIVRGVVEGIATIESYTPDGNALIARFRASQELLRYVVMKGPVCLDGVSLTVTEKGAGTFTVSLVEYTREHTNLLDRYPGDAVNIETDIIARYVESMLAARQ